jgi:predicted glycogen debranching enzyme
MSAGQLAEPRLARAPAPVRRLAVSAAGADERATLLAREWLVTNGLGGYAAGTIGGPPARRYHGLLIAALPPPLGRRLVLTDVDEALELPDGGRVPLTARTLDASRQAPLAEFRLDAGLPVWRYATREIVIEKRVVMPHGQNTTFVLYDLLEGAQSLRLAIELAVQHRSHDAPVDAPLPAEPRFAVVAAGYELTVGDLPPLRVRVEARSVAFSAAPQWLPARRYTTEEARGYMASAPTWTPGQFTVVVTASEPAAVVASTEPWDIVTALDASTALASERNRRLARIAAADPLARAGLAAELVVAADQFIVTPVGRSQEAARVRASGEERRSVIAGYHWFTDWGRDTMISLEGLTLVTGRPTEARGILRLFAEFIRDGLIPNLFPEGDDHGLYHTADATLWFFHALDRYLAVTSDRALLQSLLPQLAEIVEHHLAGTRFGIGVDPDDGLLRQGEQGLQLTWMDAKVGDWVVTPRRGKAVEINALWYNALCLLADWQRRIGSKGLRAERYEAAAARARVSFNRRFWHESGGHLYDVVDGESGDDAACRPNQLVALSLAHPVLARRYWQPVLETVRKELLTPYGLRTLSPRHRDYQPRYDGDLYSRDAAYHQGTVWPWLLGPFIDAWRRANPHDTEFTAEVLAAFDGHLSDTCIGTIGEIFDADPPFAPRGCVAQAWSVAEVLRCTLLAARDRAHFNQER